MPCGWEDAALLMIKFQNFSFGKNIHEKFHEYVHLEP